MSTLFRTAGTPLVEEAGAPPLHPLAEAFLKEQVHQYNQSLHQECRHVAQRLGDAMVLLYHAEEALEAVSKRRQRARQGQLEIALGSCCFGAFVQGFVTELAAQNSALVSIYVVLGIIGLLLVSRGVQR